jgi:hypothetical protein
MSRKILRIGFDLDGVILYNPIRTFRPIAAFLKPFFFKKSSSTFYFPKTRIEQFFWSLLHKTSFCIAPGVKDIEKLIKKHKIEAYIITARYSFLKKEFMAWMKKLKAHTFLIDAHYNKNDMQPNEFKKLMIKKLHLDIFVEDNWGVIQKLNGDLQKTKIFWITNLLDKNKIYKYKFNNLKEIVMYLEKNFTPSS